MNECFDRGSRRLLLAVVAFMGLLALSGCGAEAKPDSATPEVTGDERADVSTQTSDRTATPPVEAAQSPSARTITIAATGDVLPHFAVLGSAAINAGRTAEYNFGPMFDQIEPLMSSADLALCHLETPLSADNTGLTQPGVLSFATPREMATALADAGYDGCDFASNHTLDRGLEGLAETEGVLREAGLGYAGPTEDENRAPQTYDIAGMQVAHLAYTYTLPNSGEPNTSVPADAPRLGDSLWPKIGATGIIDDAQEARSDGADIVVVSMHWGDEYDTTPTTDQTDIARKVLNSDEVDLILGTHVHVTQPCAKINDRYVLYGLGNSLSNQSPDTDSRLRPETQEGVAATVELTVTQDGRVTSELAVQPTRVNLAGHVIEPVGPDSFAASADRTIETLRSLGQCQLTLQEESLLTSQDE
ncbi:MAG: CapA family protein [Ornithinimicrobium sp.]